MNVITDDSVISVNRKIIEIQVRHFTGNVYHVRKDRKQKVTNKIDWYQHVNIFVLGSFLSAVDCGGY